MFRLQVLESVDSTNEVIKRAIEDGEPEGLAIRAYRQTGGYGRQGRAWKSPRGGMYESIRLRPEVEMRELPTLALVVALAVRRALASLVVDDQARRICIKWPNDVVLVGGDFGADCSTRDTVLRQSCFGEQPTGLFSSCGTARDARPSSSRAPGVARKRPKHQESLLQARRHLLGGPCGWDMRGDRRERRAARGRDGG